MSTRSTKRRRNLRRFLAPLVGATALISGAGTALAQTPGTPPVQIPSAATTAPGFLGQVANLKSVKRGFKVPRNPFMAPNGRSNLHDDAYQTDTYITRGPSGRNMSVNSTYFQRNCGSVTFDAQGRIVTVCIGLQGPILVMLDPTSLQTLATFNLPGRQVTTGDVFKQVSGGGYFYLNQFDQAVIPTTTRHVFVVAEGGPTGFTQVADYDLSSVIPAGVGILSALPDWKGRIWFAGENGTVGWVDQRTGAIHSRALNEQIGNSLAVDEKGGVYIVTTRALYRLQAVKNRVKTIWRRKYPNVGFEKPGQISPGSGTTPTLSGNKYLSITDNANRMHVIFYDRGSGREVCRRGVFTAGASDTENSLVGFGNSVIVENNYGYTEQTADAGQLTSPGIARVDVKNGRCKTAWTSQERAPSSVAKGGLANGLLYAYTRPPTADGSQAWYFTAISLKSGQTIYSKLTGAGTFYNNHYAPITIGPTGAAYSGSLGGLIRLADG